jgi:hypothetical protein
MKKGDLRDALIKSARLLIDFYKEEKHDRVPGDTPLLSSQILIRIRLAPNIRRESCRTLP